MREKGLETISKDSKHAYKFLSYESKRMEKFDNWIEKNYTVRNKEIPREIMLSSVKFLRESMQKTSS